MASSPPADLVSFVNVSSLRLLCLLLLLPALASAAPKKKRVPPKPLPPSALDVGIKRALDGVEQQVGTCVLDNAADGDFTLVVRAKLTINSQGQLLGSSLVFVPEAPFGAEKMRPCIEGVLKGLVFPRSTASVLNAEREWTFSTQPAPPRP